MIKTSIFLLPVLLLNSCIDESNPQTQVIAGQPNAIINSCLTPSDSSTINTYQSGGCGGILVYGSLDSNHLLVVEIDRTCYKLGENCTPIDLQPGTKGVNIKIYERPKGVAWPFPPVCSDIACENCRYEVLTDEFVSGKIYASVSSAKDHGEGYRCTIKVQDLHLRKKGNTQIQQVQQFIFCNVLVGWNPG